MTKVAIVYHSGFGHIKAIAEHVHTGCGSVAGVESAVIAVDELPAITEDGPAGRWAEVHAADAIIMGTPTYMGTVSAKFKEFMERASKVWFTQDWRDKLAAGFTTGSGMSGDKLNVLTTLAIFAGQHSMLWVPQGIVPDADKNTNRCSSWLGYMAQTDNKPPTETPPPEDRLTAELFGTRVAEAAVRWVRGGQQPA